MTKIIGVDVGGTFTDVVVVEDGAVSDRKVPTSDDPSVAVAAAVDGGSQDVFMHGTTVATNALLVEAGARVALLTEPGYEDLIEIGRQDRPSLYDSSADRPAPLVPRSLRFSDPNDIAGADIVAVALVHSYLNPAAESEVASGLELPAILSSVVSPEFREYERFATTVLSAYLTPSVAAYLRSLDQRLPMETRLVMTSSGGLVPFAQAPHAAGRLVLSGPAGGAVAAASLGRHHGHDSVLSFDMGGTSTDVCRITGGRVAVGPGHEVGGRVNRVPSVPIHTIGAGGGSIGWKDAGGALRVGPRSAGAIPGPAAYDRGGSEPTITDANLVVGHIPEDLAMGGTVRLSMASARAAVESLGRDLGLSVDATASGMLEVVDSHMEHALRAVSVEEGADPRQAVLVAFGGAGGLHASRLAVRLGIAKVLVPPHSGVFSALGLLLATPRADAARTVMLAEGAIELGGVIAELSATVHDRYQDIFGSQSSDASASGDVRYVGQSHELEVPLSASWDSVRGQFEEVHMKRNGFTRPDEPIELVNARVAVTGRAPLAWSDLPAHSPAGKPALAGEAWKRETLPAGFELSGPAMVVETNSAVFLEEGNLLTVLDDGTLEIRI